MLYGTPARRLVRSRVTRLRELLQHEKAPDDAVAQFVAHLTRQLPDYKGLCVPLFHCCSSLSTPIDQHIELLENAIQPQLLQAITSEGVDVDNMLREALEGRAKICLFKPPSFARPHVTSLLR